MHVNWVHPLLKTISKLARLRQPTPYKENNKWTRIVCKTGIYPFSKDKEKPRQQLDEHKAKPG